MACCWSAGKRSEMKPAIAPLWRVLAAAMYCLTQSGTFWTSGKSSLATALQVLRAVKDIPKPMSSKDCSLTISSPTPAATTGALARSDSRMRQVLPQPLANF